MQKIQVSSSADAHLQPSTYACTSFSAQTQPRQ
jgi:hypothetical protein